MRGLPLLFSSLFISLAGCGPVKPDESVLKYGGRAGAGLEVQKTGIPKEIGDSKVFTTTQFGFWYTGQDGDRDEALLLAFKNAENRGDRAKCFSLRFDYTDVDVMANSSWGSGTVYLIKPGETVTQAVGIPYERIADGKMTVVFPVTHSDTWDPRADGTCPAGP